MSGKHDTGRTDYAFGPFRISLPPGWTGAFEDGVHTISTDAHDTAIQISGFERETPVTISNLYGMVPDDAEGRARFTLPSGLDGFSWQDTERETEMQVIRAGTTMLAISVIGKDEDAEAVSEILGSLVLNEESVA